MEPCLLCDPRSAQPWTKETPICGPHAEKARAAFEAAEPDLRTHLEQTYGAELDAWTRRGALPGLTWHLEVYEPAPVSGGRTRTTPKHRVIFKREPETVVRMLRALLLKAIEAEEATSPWPAERLPAGWDV